MISKHLEHDYRLAREAVFASKGCLVAPRDHTTQAHRERSAHVAKERQTVEQTDRTCNRPYWPLLTILPLRPIKIRGRFHRASDRLPECTIGLYQSVAMVTRTCVQEGVSWAPLTQIRSTDPLAFQNWQPRDKTEPVPVSVSYRRDHQRFRIGNRKRVASLNVNRTKSSISIVSRVARNVRENWQKNWDQVWHDSESRTLIWLCAWSIKAVQWPFPSNIVAFTLWLSC